jgi:hypothetical protein
VNNPNKPGKDQLRSVWFRLPPRFYQRVRKVAEECALEPEQVISQGVTLVLLEHRKKKSEVTVCSRAAATLVSRRWASTTPAERRKLARSLADRRWASKTKAEGDE